MMVSLFVSCDELRKHLARDFSDAIVDFSFRKHFVRAGFPQKRQAVVLSGRVNNSDNTFFLFSPIPGIFNKYFWISTNLILAFNL